MTSREAATLQAENRALREQLAGLEALRIENAELKKRFEDVVQLLAQQNDRLAELTAILRRREDQLRRKGRTADLVLMLPEPAAPPEDDDGPPSPSTAAPGSGPNKADKTAKGERKKRTRGGRNPLSSLLPVDEDRHETGCCAGCGSRDLTALDTEDSEKLDAVKAYVRRRRIRRAVSRCKACSGRTTAPMPPMPWPRSKITCAFLAWLVLQKFVLHVPLDRTRRVLSTQGVVLAMSTLVHWMEQAAELVAAIDGEHWKQLKAGAWLATDGTGIDVLVEGQDTAYPGILDVFTRDHLVVFTFSMTKHGDDFAELLTGFDGAVLCDAESRFGEVFEQGRKKANCNAHGRRKFRDAETVQPKLAKEGGRFLTEMYAVEAEARARDLDEAGLLALRQSRTCPIAERFHAWLEKVEPTLLPKDELGLAVRYYKRHWAALTYFIDHPEIPIDNNQCERLFQNHAKGRQAWLFAGSPEGAHRYAVLAGVIATAQRLGLDVFAYLIWLFERRGTHKKSFGLSAAQLTPLAYQQALEEEAREAAVAAK